MALIKDTAHDDEAICRLTAVLDVVVQVDILIRMLACIQINDNGCVDSAAGL